MATLITNKIITRGFGVSRGAAGRTGPIVQGYGPAPPLVPAVIEQVLRRPVVHGRSSRRIDEELSAIIVWSKLVSVNGQRPSEHIEGSASVPKEPPTRRAVFVESVRARARNTLEDFKIIVKRIKK